jgi:hypothetical protein
MRRVLVVMSSILGFLAAGLWLPGSAPAAGVSVGVQTNNVQLGIQIGDPPPLVVVPGTPVYRAPSLPYNYFSYAQQYYLFHEGRWHRSRHHDGPWIVIAVGQVPPPILAVPVDYYAAPPGHWKKHGPPPWAKAKGHRKNKHGDDWDDDHGKHRGHGKHRD